jgi:KaiC/GvpD/RAD55 family RecA-like ATPase
MNAPSIDSGYFESLVGESSPADQIAVESERQVIGYALLGKDIGDLATDDFSDWRLRKVHAAMTALSGRGEPAGIIEVSCEIGQADLDRMGGFAYLTSLTDGLLPKSGLPGWIAVIKSAARARKLRAHAIGTISDINAGLPIEIVEQRARESLDDSIQADSGQSINSFASCGDFLAVQHENIVPLIGTEDDAFLVPGEGGLLAGEAGVGKTMLATSMAANLATGENVFRWRLNKPLRVLLCQAELPAPFFQRRVKMLVDSYRLADERKARMIEENLFIAEIRQPFDITTDRRQYIEIGKQVEHLGIDVLIIDPFLSFFRGNENDNSEVRRALDTFKQCVAERYQCGIIVTDHQPKYSSSIKNPEQALAPRGAGAKRDWAATLAIISRMKTPDGQHGTFIKVTVDKMRYGKKPKDPFNVRRDDFSFRHIVFKSHEIELHEVARVLDEAGNDLSKRQLNQAVVDSLSISDHEARRLAEQAIEEGWITTSTGARGSIIHSLSEKYLDWRDGR